MTHARVHEIDLLRFIAALMVVFFHYAFRGYAVDATIMPYPLLAPLAKYGYLGVQLFFMISGFVILMTASNGNLKGFIISRMVRLYPAFWVCCTLTFVVTIAIGKPTHFASVSQYLVNMTLLSEFVGVPPMDGVYWSLFVEMRFYAMVAVVLVIGRIHQAQGFLFVWLVTSIALEWIPVRKLNFLLIVDTSALFIAGATYFLVWSQGLSRTRVGMIVLSWGLATVQAIKMLSKFETRYNTPMDPILVTGMITAFFVVMFLVSMRYTGIVGQKRWLGVGALTYPLYLLHEKIGYMIFNIAYPAINAHILFWGTLAGVLGASLAVHLFVEKQLSLPMKNALNNLVDRIQRDFHPILRVL